MTQTDRFRAAMAERGISQTQLARAASMKTSNLSVALARDRLTPATLTRLCEAMNTLCQYRDDWKVTEAIFPQDETVAVELTQTEVATLREALPIIEKITQN